MSAFSNLAKWQNYAHYLLLNLFVLFFLKYAWDITITFKQFFVLLLVVFIADTLIHFLFYSLPPPWRWRD